MAKSETLPPRRAETPLTAERLLAWRRFIEVHAAVFGALERELNERCSLSVTWYYILVQLAQAPGRSLRMSDIASVLLHSRSAVTRLVDRLSAAGLVARNACEDDRRGIAVTITPLGLESMRAAAPIHLRGIAAHWANHLSDSELEILDAAFVRILAAERPPRDSL
jgi:DNA-binding MarR family transcriptional regulator